MILRKILADIHTLEEELLSAERRYSARPETFYAAHSNGEEPEDGQWTLDFGEWPSLYRAWLTRQAEYRNEAQRHQRDAPKPCRPHAHRDMSTQLRTPEDYELFLYSLPRQYSSIRRPAVTFIRRGTSLPRVAGDVYFEDDVCLVIRERLV